jgi:release factor glutamine methyltransferase
MLLQHFKKQFFTELKNNYPITEIQSFFNILIEFKLHMTRIEVAMHPKFELHKNDLDFLQKTISDLKNYIPIQYIIGETTFYDLLFSVNNHVLIPRPETEDLVSWVIKDSKIYSEKLTVTILDIGTGSGCIAISLAKNIPNSKVFAIDISSEALKIANQNAQINNVKIQFIEADILNICELPQKFDIIVSNPPYVRELEKEQMQQNVLAHEPHVALFVKDKNPLLFYDKIADLAKNHLSENGSLFFEINQYLGNETSDLLKSKGFKHIKLKKDIFGIDRMIKTNI